MVLIGLIVSSFLASVSSTDLLLRTRENSTVLSQAAICNFPVFLQNSLGVKCTEKGTDRIWFSKKSPPVRKTLLPNETCTDDRYEWPGENGTKLCCLELHCPSGQVLAKDDRNTLPGECPRCRNIIYEYVCDLSNDTCPDLHVGSSCRHFFNSSALFICACDNSHGYTQNRMAFPVNCTKTIGATCFMQEHCTMVDTSAVCVFGNQTRPPKGHCQCLPGYLVDNHGRCQNENVTTKNLVKRQAVIDWGDASNWEEGAIDSPYFQYESRQVRDGKKSAATSSPVLSQTINDNISLHTERTRNAATTLNPFDPHTSKSQISVPQPQPFMISAKLLNEVTTKIASTSTVSTTTAMPAVSVAWGTHFAPDNDDTVLDSVLDIVRPARKKLQTERPTTSSTWDVSVHPVVHDTSTSKSTTVFVPYWQRSSPSASVGSTALSTPVTTTPSIRTAAEQSTTKSSWFGFDIFGTKRPRTKPTDQTSTLTTTTTVPSTSTATTSTSTTSTQTSTTTAKTTEKSTVPSTTTTAKTSMITTMTLTSTTSEASMVERLKDQELVTPLSTISVPSGLSTTESHIIRFNLHDGVEIFPHHLHDEVVSTTSPPESTASNKAIFHDAANSKAIDFSFLKDSTLSKAQVEKKLIQALLDLTATTTTTTTTTTTPAPTTTMFDLSFLSMPNISSAELELRLLPLLASFREQSTSTASSSTSTSTQASSTTTAAKSSAAATIELPEEVTPGRLAATGALAAKEMAKVTLAPKAADAAGLRNQWKPARAVTKRPAVKETAATTLEVEGQENEVTETDVTNVPVDGETTSASAAPKKKKISFFNAIMGAFGAVRPRKSVGQTTAETTTLVPTTTTSTNARAKPVTRRKLGSLTANDTDDSAERKIRPVAGFGQVLSGFGSIIGSILGGGQRLESADSTVNQDDASSEKSFVKPGGKLDLSNPEAQLQLAKLMAKGDPSMGNPISPSAVRNAFKPKTPADAKKFSFDDPQEQVQFVKFLQNFDKYKPANAAEKPSDESEDLFPKPPPVQERPGTTTAPTNVVYSGDQEPDVSPSGDQVVTSSQAPVVGSVGGSGKLALSPETWALISQMQQPGYYNVTPEQMNALQPVLHYIQSQQKSGQPAPQFVAPPSTTTTTQEPVQTTRALADWNGDQYDSYDSVQPVAPFVPQIVPAELPATIATTTIGTTTTKAPTNLLKLVFDSQGKSYIPSSDVNQVAAPINPPKRPPFVADPIKCPVSCQQQDPKSTCDTRFGTCSCVPGYRPSFLEGNICTQNIFSLCSTDEDCRSGGDINSDCAFNGDSRFCTCTNGYLPDADGTCQKMFSERCTKTCSDIPNAICDSVKGICKCPTGYAWFKDPWTGQPVCRASLGGSVPCRADQDLCPVYSPRGKCRNNVFCGCEDGYIPDSWFTNHSERTACIDVLSARCEDSSECTAADRNTLCDRRLRMCICKPGYKPDPAHVAPCMVDPEA